MPVIRKAGEYKEELHAQPPESGDIDKSEHDRRQSRGIALRKPVVKDYRQNRQAPQRIQFRHGAAEQLVWDIALQGGVTVSKSSGQRQYCQTGRKPEGSKTVRQSVLHPAEVVYDSRPDDDAKNPGGVSVVPVRLLTRGRCHLVPKLSITEPSYTVDFAELASARIDVAVSRNS